MTGLYQHRADENLGMSANSLLAAMVSTAEKTMRRYLPLEEQDTGEKKTPDGTKVFLV
jgi:hypothetical protein